MDAVVSGLHFRRMLHPQLNKYRLWYWLPLEALSFSLFHRNCIAAKYPTFAKHPTLHSLVFPLTYEIVVKWKYYQVNVLYF